MYPKTPDLTPEQRETIEYWLKVAGSEGKGCRNEPKPTDLDRLEAELYKVASDPDKYGVIATNVAKRLSRVRR